jgi:hypothetical protein
MQLREKLSSFHYDLTARILKIKIPCNYAENEFLYFRACSYLGRQCTRKNELLRNNGLIRPRQLDIPTGRQTYRSIKVELILILTNDKKKQKM